MILPKLRADLNFMPSPIADKPGLLIRDVYQYSNEKLIVPPLLVQGLKFFNGTRTDADLCAELVRLSGKSETENAAKQLIETLSNAGFLENQIHWDMKERQQRSFSGNPVRQAKHMGSAYPQDLGALQKLLHGYLDPNGGSDKDDRDIIGIAAPHISLEGGWQCYRAAYQNLPTSLRKRTFIVIGTSHYGTPNKFGLTRKPYQTPFGVTNVNRELVDELSAEPAVVMEDYCHAIEHSIELQVIFLQTIFGPDICILPILCGPFRPNAKGGYPRDDAGVRGFLDALRGIAEREQERLFWVLGVDMAHMGIRYGDTFAAKAGRDEMLKVSERDGHG